MNRFVVYLAYTFISGIIWVNTVYSAEQNNWKPNWLAVSDLNELSRTWESALVYLPDTVFSNFGSPLLLKDEDALSSKIKHKLGESKLPLVLFLHGCEGLGHHREEIVNIAKLGFAVIAPDSFARRHRPLGCYEEQEEYIRYYDIAIAFQKAELDYAINRIKRLEWVDVNQQFLFGSGTGGMVVAHYMGKEFAGHIIEGWGCKHAHDVFDGIWAPASTRIFSVISKNDPWFKGVPGFGIDCEKYIEGRPDSVAILLDRPAHYVSWYPGSREPLIKFLTRDLDVDIDGLIDNTPIIIKANDAGIVLKSKWSTEDVYKEAKKYCSKLGKTNHLNANTDLGIYSFVCTK
jgi:hypothetical protein